MECLVPNENIGYNNNGWRKNTKPHMVFSINVLVSGKFRSILMIKLKPAFVLAVGSANILRIIAFK